MSRDRELIESWPRFRWRGRGPIRWWWVFPVAVFVPNAALAVMFRMPLYLALGVLTALWHLWFWHREYGRWIVDPESAYRRRPSRLGTYWKRLGEQENGSR